MCCQKGYSFWGFKSVQSVYNFIIRFPQQEMLLEIMDNFKTGISNLYEYTSCDWMKLLCQNQQQIFNYKGRWKEKDFVLEQEKAF